MKRIVLVFAASAIAAPASLAAPPLSVTAYGPNVGTTDALIPRLFKNCTALNRKYPDGVGKVGARDRTTSEPVTTFKRSNKLYRLAMSYNRGLDRDKDGIACEKR